MYVGTKTITETITSLVADKNDSEVTVIVFGLSIVNYLASGDKVLQRDRLKAIMEAEGGDCGC